MERLTTHDPNRQLLVCSANYKSWNEIYDRLAYYEDLEEQGRLIVLPCKVGDTLYVVGYCGEIYTHRDWETGAQECPFEGDCELEECDDNTLRVFETTCDGFVLDKLDKKLHITLKSIGLDSGDVLGERVFLTRSNAEKDLEMMS